MEQWKQRLREAREAKGLNKTAFAKAVGVSNATITDWEKSVDAGGIKEISGTKLVKVCQVLEVDTSWLMHGPTAATGEPEGKSVSLPPAAFDENVSPAPIGMRPVPVISSVQAGALRDMESPYPSGAGYAMEYTDQDLSRWAFALDVEGLSMAPQFQPGDRIIVDPDLAPNPGDFVVARNGSEQATFKKYRPRGIDSRGEMIFELVPLNEDYPTLRSDNEKLVVIGVVTEHRKKLRRV